MTVHRQLKISSPVGNLYLVASATGLRGLYFDPQDVPMARVSSAAPEGKILGRAARELKEYFAGRRRRFELPLEFPDGSSNFRRGVWKELQRIPYGQTRSYRQVAERVSSRAVRAVGTANAKNPLCIVIPCHRVISSSGGLGGYSGGIEKKQKLLELEKKFRP